MASVFGNKLKAVRKQRGMVQKQLGDLTGVGQVTIANYEKGIRFPGEETLKTLAEVLQVSLDYLLSVAPPEQSTGSFHNDRDAPQFSVRYLLNKFLNPSIDSGLRYLNLWKESEVLSLEDIFSLVLSPLLFETGELWARGEISVAEEHVITARIREVIILLGRKSLEGRERLPENHKVWLGFSAPGEEHDIAPLMISRLMKLRGWDTVFLGAGVPLPSLLDAVGKYKPAAIVISVTMERNLNGLEAYLAALAPRLKQDCRVILGGQGLAVTDFELSAGNYRRAKTIREAVEMAEE